MEIKLKMCSGCEKPKHIYKNIVVYGVQKKFCKPCSFKLEKKYFQIKAPRKPIPFQSKKRVEQDAEYKILRVQFLKDNPFCKINIDGCIKKSKEVHHKRGRNKYYLDIETWLPTCRHCHHWVENHPTEAIEKGFSELRLAKY